MNIEMNDGFNIVYAKIGRSPKSKLFKTKLEVIDFFIDNVDNIDFLSINDIIIDKNKLINDNKYLGRYLKLNKIYEI